MSTKNKPLLSDDNMQDECHGAFGMEREQVREFYEADRAKLLDRIEKLEGTTRYETVPKELYDREVAARQPNVARMVVEGLDEEDVMAVYHAHEHFFSLHGSSPAKRSANFRARIKNAIKLKADGAAKSAAHPQPPAKQVTQMRDEMELLGAMIRAERSNPSAESQQCTDEQLERCYVLRDALEGVNVEIVTGDPHGTAKMFSDAGISHQPDVAKLVEAGDAMMMQFGALARQYRDGMVERGGSPDLHPLHSEALSAWGAAKSAAHPQPPEKAPTDDEINDLARQRFGGYGDRHDAFVAGARYFRDNGYLAPAKVDGWIPVAERLPEDELKPVLVKTKDEAGWEQLFSAYCSEDEDPAYWILDMPMLCENQKDVRIPGVTHWMHLPASPNS
jgi:hypothetical protein